MAQTVRINERAVTHELVDDEVIVVNLETGCYFSLQGVAADCWLGIVQAPTVAALAGAVAARYAAALPEVQRDVEAFVALLEGEGLVRREPGPPPPAPGGPAGAPGPPPGPYRPPVMEKYEDMRDLLVLDPIHEVDEGGWPTRRAVDAASDA